MAILQTTTIVTSGAGPVKVPGSSPLGAETVTVCQIRFRK